MSYIKFENIVKEYKTGDVTIKALDNTNFKIEKGELATEISKKPLDPRTVLKVVDMLEALKSVD